MLCNFAAIPATRALTGMLNKEIMLPNQSRGGYQWCVTIGICLIVLSSVGFFFVAMVPVLVTVTRINNTAPVPKEVMDVIGMTMGLYFAFATVGLAAILPMVYVVTASAGQSDLHTSFRKIMTFQLIGFEVLNLGKWFIAFFVMVGVMNTTPIWG